MQKTKTKFSCQNCGYTSAKWEGRCHGCSSWNTLVEEFFVEKKNTRGWSISSTKGSVKTANLSQDLSQENNQRYSTGIQELDRVLGGGVIPGSYTLVGGDPGIGKSTLLMQMAGGLAEQNKKVLYVSGEESISQTALRAQRLGLKNKNVEIAAESELGSIINLTQSKKPHILIIDSIQAVYLSELNSSPGSISQVKECSSQLMAVAKNLNTSIFIVGHVTKDGHIAGPKVLEHMVDTVLSFEGDHSHQFRLLRALKNRFGATNELGVFQMNSQGLKEVNNPSELFLEERSDDSIGSSIFAAMEGSRPLLCETQSLVCPTHLSIPRRTTLGLDINRVHLLIAVLDKNLNLGLSKSDVFASVVGGLKLNEPAADLSIAASFISSAKQIKIHPACSIFGEVGLTGEIRATSFPEERIKEGEKLGFTQWIIPESNKKHIQIKNFKKNINIHWIKHLSELQNILLKLKDEIKN